MFAKVSIKSWLHLLRQRILKKVVSFLASLRSKFSDKEYKKLLPKLYVFGLVLGLILSLLYTIYPSLVYCTSFFGDDFCTPVGLFLAIMLSLPGYLIVGNILPFLPTIPIVVSVISVLVLAGAIYYFIGLFIDKLKKVKRAKRGRTFESSKITIFIVGFFVLILIIFLILLGQTQ